MRKLLLAAAALAVLVTTPAIARTAKHLEGPVIAVDEQAHSFTCGQPASWTYKTTDKTIFLMGRKSASFSDIKVGDSVRVPKFHSDGQDHIADRVLISSK